MTFSDTYNLRNSLASWNLAANALDALIQTITQTELTSLINTTGAEADYTGASHAITTASGNALLVLAKINLSHSADQGGGSVYINLDGANETVPIRYVAPVANTAGDRNSVMGYHLYTAPSVGAHTVKLRWVTAVGTIYSAGATLTSIVLRTS